MAYITAQKFVPSSHTTRSSLFTTRPEGYKKGFLGPVSVCTLLFIRYNSTVWNELCLHNSRRDRVLTHLLHDCDFAASRGCARALMSMSRK